jgi:four helix bundle protein
VAATVSIQIATRFDILMIANYALFDQIGAAISDRFRGRAKSDADFISKMTTVEEEGDEALYWFEVLVETETVRKDAVATLMDEADQLVRIIVASINTTRGSSR